ncbi:MAG: hypothetical protein GY775_19410 [Candidatus Scalindua sp.]|nr:hypothetical protein [Candidatus Scalindua sp.]
MKKVSKDIEDIEIYSEYLDSNSRAKIKKKSKNKNKIKKIKIKKEDL